MEADDPRAARKSAPGQPWSHAETMHLIDVYEDRWTKLRRGQLKAHQWEDVAAEVTHRCGGQRKTGTQCRHKLEKLRKRYRTEGARPVTSLWPFFRRMERLERGPVPTATVSSSFAASPPASDEEQEEEEEEDEEQEEEEGEEDHEEEEEEQLLVARNSSSNTRSINGLVRDAGGFRGGFAPRQQQQQPSPPSMTLSTAPPRKRVTYEAAFQSKAAAADNRVKVEEAPAVDHRSVAGVLRDIGEGIKRLERRRMEVQWEIERGWKETEARNNQMLQLLHHVSPLNPSLFSLYSLNPLVWACQGEMGVALVHHVGSAAAASQWMMLARWTSTNDPFSLPRHLSSTSRLPMAARGGPRSGLPFPPPRSRPHEERRRRWQRLELWFVRRASGP